MTRNLLIDAAHLEEIRVAVVENGHLVEFDSESSHKKQIKGNIYLAKVVRIEPSLQAAFVDYGNDKHGFLPFAEIHPNYYRIPISDRPTPEEIPEKSQILEEAETDVDDDEDVVVKRPRVNYRYKIQEVIQRKQVILVQAVKEQRGNKGAAFTTYLSLPGRYCVLMPNAGKRSGGISRKIQDEKDRIRLRDILKNLEIPEGMSLIVRTAGEKRSKLEIKRDYDYLIKLWEEIREKTLNSIAPNLIHEEGDLVKRSMRDIYSRDIDEVLVEGDEAYKKAKAFMKKTMPSHVKKVILYKDSLTPLFFKFNVEQHIDKMFLPKVDLPSGGSIVINHTEALVAIDVNSGRATKERNIDVTALKTNLEAAQEIARQLRLRDLSGLIVIDFIDMEEHSHINQVERKFREAIRLDRARTQIGKISQFGLLELSRQRLRPSMLETHASLCAHCHGTGLIRSVESLALQILRATEREAIKEKILELQVAVPSGVDLYLLNQLRREIGQIENRYAVNLFITRETIPHSPFFRIDVIKQKETPIADQDEENVSEEKVSNKNKKHKKIPKKEAAKPEEQTSTEILPADEVKTEETETESKAKKRYRRFRNRRYRHPKPDSNNTTEQASNDSATPAVEIPVESTPPSEIKDSQPHKKTKNHFRKKKNSMAQPAQNESTPLAEKSEQQPVEKTEKKSDKKPSKRKESWLRRLLD